MAGRAARARRRGARPRGATRGGRAAGDRRRGSGPAPVAPRTAGRTAATTAARDAAASPPKAYQRGARGRARPRHSTTPPPLARALSAAEGRSGRVEPAARARAPRTRRRRTGRELALVAFVAHAQQQPHVGRRQVGHLDSTRGARGRGGASDGRSRCGRRRPRGRPPFVGAGQDRGRSHRLQASSTRSPATHTAPSAGASQRTDSGGAGVAADAAPAASAVAQKRRPGGHRARFCLNSFRSAATAGPPQRRRALASASSGAGRPLGGGTKFSLMARTLTSARGQSEPACRWCPRPAAERLLADTAPVGLSLRRSAGRVTQARVMATIAARSRRTPRGQRVRLVVSHSSSARRAGVVVDEDREHGAKISSCMSRKRGSSVRTTVGSTK